MRRFAISDIHGCCKTFKYLVKDIIQLTKEDRLFLLGDYIDRGPDSKGVIDFILQLQEEGYQVDCVRGNHEEMLLDGLKSDMQLGSWLINGGRETLRSFEVIDPNDIPHKYFKFIEELKLYIELEDYLLVHAGFNFKDEDFLEDKYAMLWIRRWHGEFDIDRTNGKIIIHGHTPMLKDDIVKAPKLELPVDIDAGCAYYHIEGLGFLCAYNLDTKEFYFQENMDI